VHILWSCVRDIAYVICEHESFVRAAVLCHATDAWRAYIREIKAMVCTRTQAHDINASTSETPEYTRKTPCRTIYSWTFRLLFETVCVFDCVCVRVRACACVYARARAHTHTHTHTHIHRQLIDKRRIYYSWPMFAAREISQEILLSDESTIANYHVFGNVSMHKSYRTLWLSRTNEIEHPWLTSTV